MTSFHLHLHRVVPIAQAAAPTPKPIARELRIVADLRRARGMRA